MQLLRKKLLIKGAALSGIGQYLNINSGQIEMLVGFFRPAGPILRAPVIRFVISLKKIDVENGK
jgi:hypothetical protein